jgi:predicted RNA polymerase sigma factor
MTTLDEVTELNIEEVARADFHRRTDALEESRNDYQRALQPTENDTEKRFIRQRLEAIS